MHRWDGWMDDVNLIFSSSSGFSMCRNSNSHPIIMIITIQREQW